MPDDAPANDLAQPATMHDVARRAGVSIKSVSRVINAEPHVSAKLRAKVESAIAELHYVPDPAARSLAGARSFTIGILLDNPSPNYTMKVVSGVYQAASSRSYHLRIDAADTSRGDNLLRNKLEHIVANGRIDGFVLTPPLTDHPVVLDFLEARGIRYCRIAPVTDPGRSPAVAIDDAAAAGEMAAYLWGLGHRRFGIVTGPAAHGAANARRSGFVARLQELLHNPSIAEADGDFSFATGIEAGLKLLRSEPRPTAIFAANDDSAAGVMVACSQAGLSVPRDISVCGFDDSWVAMSVWPYLTTVYQPIEEMGRAAANMLLERDAGSAPWPVKMLDYRMIVRDSVGPAPQ